MWKIAIVVFSALFAFEVGAQVGGFSSIDVTDPGAVSALDYAVAEHNKGSNDLYIYQPTRVISVQRQLVAGYKYVITAVMTRTKCKKVGAKQTCDVHTDPTVARSYQCVFTVWVRPWDNYMSVLNQTC